MIIFTFDVLAYPGDQVGERQPSQDGRRLWNIMASAGAPVAVIINAQDRPDHVHAWLRQAGYQPDLVDPAVDNTARSKYDRVSALRATLGRCEFYLDTDPGSILPALEEGIPSLLVVTPLVARPDWRARTRSSWDDLVIRIQNERTRRLDSFKDDDDD